jgi:hypothetical protein
MNAICFVLNIASLLLLITGLIYLYFIISIVILLFHFIVIFSFKSSNFKTLFFSLIHLSEKGKIDREIILSEMFNRSQANINNINKIDKLSLIKKHISPNQSIIRFIHEKDVRDNFIRWSMYSPLDRLNLDYKKQVLSHDRMKCEEYQSISKDVVERYFSLYSPKDIVRMFTTYYNFEDYLYCIDSGFNGNFPIKKDVKSLRNYLMDINEKDYCLIEKNKWLSNLGASYRVVKNKRDLFDLADKMENCLKSYDEKLKRNKTIIVSYSFLNKIDYVVEIIPDKGLVREIKGFKNMTPFKSEELKIKKEIFIAFKNRIN